MDTDTSATIAPSKQPKPQRTACRRCHVKKVRCNASYGQACSGCRTAGLECVAHIKRRRNRGPPRDESATLPGLLPNIPRTPPTQTSPSSLRASLVESQEPSYEHDNEDANIIESTETWCTDTTTQVPPMAGADNLPEQESQGGYQRREDTEEVNEAAAALSALQDGGGVQHHLVEMLSQEDLDQRIIQKGVRAVYVGQEFSNINYLIRHRARNHAVHHFPADQIARPVGEHQLDRVPKEAFFLPSSSITDELVERYFRLVNPGFPILDEEVFMRQYKSKDPLDPPSLLVLQAVLMVGAHVSLDRPDREDLKADFFRRAKMLYDARLEYNRDLMVQAALLLTWHSEGMEDVSSGPYYWVTEAVRTAFGLGMHRDCNPSTLVTHDRRIWRRMWWILVQFDVLVTLTYGRPQAINLEDADVPLPTMKDLDGLQGNADGDFFIHHTALCIVISKALRQIFGPHVSLEKRAAAIEEADRQLALWLMGLPFNLQPQSRGSKAEISIWESLLHITYNNFLILLHRPAPKIAMSRLIRTEDIGICTSAAATLVTFFESIYQREQLGCLNVFAVNALFTTLIQLSAEMRIKNPLLSASATKRFDAALDVLRTLSKFWLNAAILQHLFEGSSDRLRDELRIGKKQKHKRNIHHQHKQQRSLPVNVNIPMSASPQESISAASGSTETVVMGSFGSSQSGDWSNNTLVNCQPLDSDGQGANHSIFDVSIGQQVDWMALYWDNSGFDSLSPFQEMGLHQPT